MAVRKSALLFSRRLAGAAGAALLLAHTQDVASAAEPKGCDGFKWPLKLEASRLQASGLPGMPTDGTAQANGQAYDLKLVALTEAHLPTPPERAPKISPSTAGFATFAAPKAGSYQIVVSQVAWIDVVQNGQYTKPSAFSGATDCPGVRKSIRVNLAAAPFTLQISSASASSIGIIVEKTPQ